MLLKKCFLGSSQKTLIRLFKEKVNGFTSKFYKQKLFFPYLFSKRGGGFQVFVFLTRVSCVI